MQYKTRGVLLRTILTITFTALIFFHSSKTYAGVLVEPYVGSNLNGGIAGDSIDGIEEIDDSNPNPWEVSGSGIGGRIGFQHAGIFGAIDGVLSTSNSAGDFESDYQEWAIDAGYQFPFLLRLWVGYIYSASLSGENKNDSNDKQQVDFTKGTGSKFGIGFNPFPYVSLNFEIKSVQFKEFEFKQNGSTILDDQAFEDEISSTDNNKLSYYFLSLSVPLDL